MKFSTVLPFVAVTSALVVPPEQVLRDLEVQDHHRHSLYDEAVHQKDEITAEWKELFGKSFDEVKEAAQDTWSQVKESSQNAFDEAYEFGSEKADVFSGKVHDASSEVQSWTESKKNDLESAFDDHHHHPPHHGHEPNQTVYQLIASSKYSTRLVKLINEFDDLVEALNSTKANYTVFAPTDKAFEKIPEDAPKPTKEQLKKFLSYHVIPDFYPAGRVLAGHTAATLLKEDSLGGEAQRVSFRLGLRGVTVNFISRVVAINIFGTNGVIHGVDTPVFPPPSAITEVDLFPGAFSTLELGLGKTGLLDTLNTTKHNGGTLFAPNNDAFLKLGPRANAFLFSQAGLKYLKALLEYHVVPDQTLYSDAYYKGSAGHSLDHDHDKNPFTHIDLPTLLKDRSLSVDILTYGPFIQMKVNGFTGVDVKDVPAEDGVIHVITNVIVPPKKIGGSDEVEYWQGEELSEEDLVERLQPFVPKSDL